jgi:Tol biopolymer transport system component
MAAIPIALFALTVCQAPALSGVEISILTEGAGRVDWSHANNRIVFDALGTEDRFYDLYLIEPDGSGRMCLTCDVNEFPDLPHHHMGQPAWHPSGRFLVFQAEKKRHLRRPLHRRFMTPGIGLLNDLWLLDLETKQVTLLWEVPNKLGRGVLHPHFSEDGTRLSWSELIQQGTRAEHMEFGDWRLMLGDIDVYSALPTLTNVQDITPGTPGFYENHGFSPDGGKVLFTSNLRELRPFQTDIYTLDLETSELVQLTTDGYNEHAHFHPSGSHIVWMHDSALRRSGTDLWIMRSDGSEKQQVTFMNDPNHPHYSGTPMVMADFAWNGAGTEVVVYASRVGQRKKGRRPSTALIVRFPDVLP